MPVKYSQMADKTLVGWVAEDASNFSQLYACIRENYEVQILEELIGMEQCYVDIAIKGKVITLHSEANLGVCVMASTPDTNETVQHVAEVLLDRLAAK